MLIEDRSTWPVTRVADRHVFQVDAVTHRRQPIFHTIVGGGLEHLLLGAIPREATILAQPLTPTFVDDFATALAGWCTAHGHPLVRITFPGPQAPAHAVATTLRRRYTARRTGRPAARALLRAR